MYLSLTSNLAYASNACIVRAIKLLDDINLKQTDKKYDLVKVIFHLDDFNTSDCSDLKETLIKTLTKVRPTIIL